MFVPKISITNIPADASSMLITDITGNWPTDPTGYEDGVPPDYLYYPQDNTQWAKLVEAQKLGEVPVEYLFSPLTDKTEVAGTIPINLTDGVWLVTQYFLTTTGIYGGNLLYSINGAGDTLTRTGGDPWVDAGSVPGIFSDVYAICGESYNSAQLIDFHKVTSLNSTTLVVNGDTQLTANDPLTLVFRVQKYILVMNEGEQSLISDIGSMAIAELEGQGCNENKSCLLAHRLMLKLSAQIAFADGNYSKAHKAAILFNQSTSGTSECTSC